MVDLKIIPTIEFNRVWNSNIDTYDRLSLIADMCRLNTLVSVKKAGSGHLGSSFSAMDIVVWLYYQEMNTRHQGFESEDRDIYFSSKGHDVPGLYSVLHSLGLISDEKLLMLRRLEGLHGHPDISDSGIEANSGSLGMGISKARGMAWAKTYLGRSGRIFVMTGDGELQEGQIYEALQGAAHLNQGNLTAIVDHNKVQTDKPVKEIIDLGDLHQKFTAFGWHVERCNGHDFSELESVFKSCAGINDRPKIIVADTIKGRGISFMEHPAALKEAQGLYPWHSGAPNDEMFAKGQNELIAKIRYESKHFDLGEVNLKSVTSDEKELNGAAASFNSEQLSQVEITKQKRVSDEYVANAYGEALLEFAREKEDFVVLDGDLAADCRLRGFEKAYPTRFIEAGIAEQDMVSMAGGLARQGITPVVNTFASFLSSRANEQIYNNATEQTKIVYVCHYAGLIPAGPGKSHQSVRDVSLLGALPNIRVIQPCNALETKAALRYCLFESEQNCMLRIPIGPSPQIIKLPADYRFEDGRGTLLRRGSDGIIFSYGPVMLNESIGAVDLLQEKGIAVGLINLPWLNSVDTTWLKPILDGIEHVFIVEDHSPVGGLGAFLINNMVESGILDGRTFRIFGVEGFPICGTPIEALNYHHLDASSISKRISSIL